MKTAVERLSELRIQNSEFPFLLLRTRAGKRLARLDLDDFAFVANALALVRLGLADLADGRRELPDRLFVRAGHFDLVRAFELHRDVARDRHADLIRVADGQDEV